MKKFELIRLTNAACEAAVEVANLIQIPTSRVKLGGSLSLVLQDIIDRDIHGIDIIVNTPIKYECIKIQKCLAAFSKRAGKFSQVSDVSLSYYAGNINANGKKYAVNVILDTCNHKHMEYIPITKDICLQHPSITKWAKISYKRPKDIDDIKAIEKWELENNCL